MFQKSLLALLCLSFLSLEAQDCASNFGTATAPSGLIIRKSPGKGYVYKIPFGDTLSFCSDSTYGSLTFESITGFWRKVRYKGKEGYSFDGFIETIGLSLEQDSIIAASKKLIAAGDSALGIVAEAKPESPHTYYKDFDFQLLLETYNYCGPVDEIDLKLYWYGVFMDNEMNPTGKLAIRPLNLNVSLSKRKVGTSLEFDVLTDDEERSLFVFGVSNSFPYQELTLSDVLPTIGTRGRRLFPGQEWLLDPSSNLRLSATGAITKAGPCPETKEYSLKAVRGSGANEAEQDLKSILGDYGSCSIPEIYWYGDLSGDGLPEIIFVSVRDEQNVFSLLESNSESSQLFSLKAVFTVENCAN